MRLDTAIKPQERFRRFYRRVQVRKWADLMATNGQFPWPSVGISVAAYGQLVTAADSYECAWPDSDAGG